MINEKKIFPAKPKSNVEDWIDHNVALYEKDIATPEQLEKLQKRLDNARAHVTPVKENNVKPKRNYWNEFVASGGKKLPELSKEEIKQVQGDQKVRNYILRNYKPKSSKKKAAETFNPSLSDLRLFQKPVEDVKPIKSLADHYKEIVERENNTTGLRYFDPILKNYDK
tara:strand:- start:545 stop:1048 length:504 start_codon:yes stop_codon:yes gene_type:complete